MSQAIDVSCSRPGSSSKTSGVTSGATGMGGKREMTLQPSEISVDILTAAENYTMPESDFLLWDTTNHGALASSHFHGGACVGEALPSGKAGNSPRVFKKKLCTGIGNPEPEYCDEGTTINEERWARRMLQNRITGGRT